MKRYGLLGILVLVFVLILTGFPVMAGEKVGLVDIREVMLSSDAGKKAVENFKKLIEKNRAIIQEREAELKKLKDELEKQSSILTETARKEKEAAYQKKFRDYQLLVKDINEDLQAKEQGLAKEMVPEILKLVTGIGEREKYILILDIGSAPIAYFAKENDITKLVIEEFNKTHKPQD